MLRANRTSPWRPPKPTLHIWMDATMYAGVGKTDSGLHFQHTWSEQEARKHINWLELRAARYALLELASPRDRVQHHLEKITAIAFIKRMGGTPSLSLSKKRHLLWRQAIRNEHQHSLPSMAIHIREHKGGFPQQTHTAEVRLQIYLVRVLEGLVQISSLAHTDCLHVQRESPDSQVHDLGAGLQGIGNQCPGLLLGSRNLVIPPVPLIPLVLEGVLEQQIKAILICQGWKGAMWGP